MNDIKQTHQNELFQVAAQLCDAKLAVESLEKRYNELRVILKTIDALESAAVNTEKEGDEQ